MDTQQCPFCGLESSIEAATCAACGLPFRHEGVTYRRPSTPGIDPVARPWVRPTTSARRRSTFGSPEHADDYGSAVYDTLFARVREHEASPPGVRRGPAWAVYPDPPVIIPDPEPAPKAPRSLRIGPLRLRLNLDLDLDRHPVLILAVVLGLLATALGAAIVMGRPTPLGMEQEWLAATGDWVAFHDPERMFAADFPTAPEVAAETHAGEQRRGLVHADQFRVHVQAHYTDYLSAAVPVGDGQEFADATARAFAAEVQGTVQAAQPAYVAERPGAEFVISTPDGSVWRVAAVTVGHRSYRLAVGASVDPTAAFQRFTASFHPLHPETTTTLAR